MQSEKKLTFLLLFLFLLSRIPYINPAPVFFDSGEYLNLFSLSSFPLALFTGHFPLHIGYIILGWPIYHLANLLNINPAISVILSQNILTALALYCLFYFTSYISDKKTAFLTVLFISLTPLFWTTNATIMMENAYLSFFCFSLYFLTKWLQKNKKINLHLSAFFLTLAVLTHMLLTLWIPFVISIIYLKKKKVFIKSSLTFFIYLIFFLILNVFLIAKTLGMEPSRVAFYLYLSKQQEFALANPSIHTLLISIRNFIVLLFANFTGLLIIMGSISLIKEFKNKSKNMLLGFLWIAPAFIANQWWDSLLPGRHALISALGFSFLTALLLKNKPKLTFIFVIYLFIVSFPAVNLLRYQIPYLEEAQALKNLPQESLLIETHFAKPQIESIFKGEVLAVNQAGSENYIIDKAIKKYLSENKPVFISEGALSEPYGLYSGPYVHALAMSYLHSFQLEEFIKNYSLIKYQTINTNDNLFIYKIVSANPSPYPKITQLKNSKRRIDFFDPISRALTYFIYR